LLNIDDFKSIVNCSNARTGIVECSLRNNFKSQITSEDEKTFKIAKELQKQMLLR
jgi:hypothetical protein